VIGKRIVLVLGGVSVLLALTVVLIGEVYLGVESGSEHSIGQTDDVEKQEKVYSDSPANTQDLSYANKDEISNEDYSSKKESSGGVEFEVTDCSVEDLAPQLEELLLAEMIPIQSGDIETVIFDHFETLYLPFGTERSCAVTWRSVNEFADGDLGDYVQPNIFSDYLSKFELGGESFRPDTADGPLSSYQLIPLLVDGPAVQFLEIEQRTELSSSDFPKDISCPCSLVTEVTLTAPMRP
tara:strand:- start:7453 stop:8169 length:717 start_codon:yes stop_codon:yes gene_type:complete